MCWALAVYRVMCVGRGLGIGNLVWLLCVLHRSRILHYPLVAVRVVGWWLIVLFRVLAKGRFKVGGDKVPSLVRCDRSMGKREGGRLSTRVTLLTTSSRFD